ncbi:MAG: M1 family metallopeptidase [Pseudomonadota bacterium]
MPLLRVFLIVIVTVATAANVPALARDSGPGSGARAFEQLDKELPTPNVYRNASGAPGPQYWQQRADYVINVTLDEVERRIVADQRVTYTNNSPDALRYLWVALDQNRFDNDSIARRTEVIGSGRAAQSLGQGGDEVSYYTLRRYQAYTARDHGFDIVAVEDENGEALPFTIVDTMMRIDLPTALASGQSISFSIDFAFNIVDEPAMRARAGFERFEDDTYLYFLAQWFPRMASYTDYSGWANKAFLGRGEFTLEFGDYDVSITTPADHIVSSTGVLQNPEAVLTPTQRERLREAEQTTDSPVFIVTPEEALENEKEGTSDTKTWRFTAENVRDFAWASSRKFIWDAMNFEQDDEENPNVLVMSFYPNEAEPIWSKYSSHAVAHTMEVYSRFSFAYPYPTAQSVNTWNRGGMEYPMITFNGYRPTDEEKADERTYARAIKYRLIGVIIHEIGHIYFPMIVNSDERQWTWMDEGLNTFLEYVASIEWEENYPAYGGDKVNILDHITEYMTSARQVPIMTQSDSILQFGPNAYRKPAAALTVLRETVMGRELFDFAFREYAQRWMFKRPTPSDFFRTMEDASGVDLDWFWRGWFYSTDHVDLSVADIREYKLATNDPEIDLPLERELFERDYPEPLNQIRNREAGMETYVERHPELADFYNENDQFTVTNADRNEYRELMEDEDGLEQWEKDALRKALEEDYYVYFVEFGNHGGLVMPIPLTIRFEDGAVEELMIPAEVWRIDAESVTQLFIRDKRIVEIGIDEHHQIADADRSDNYFPRRIYASRLQAYKSDYRRPRNLMKEMMEELKEDEKERVYIDPEFRPTPLRPLEAE